MGFRTSDYLQRNELVRYQLDDIIRAPGNNQHQIKNGYNFTVNDRSNFYDWYNAYFEVRFQLQKVADGDGYAAADRITVINGAHSLIKHLMIKSAGKIVYDTDNLHNDTFVKNLMDNCQRWPEQTFTTITFHSYPLDKRLCIVELLSAYVKRTAPLRKETKQLLICHAEPHGPASRDTISRWIKQTMKDAGIDTTVFKPHSTRGASTSAAKALNVPVQVIMNTAGWRSDSTFAKFYDRPVLTANNFAAAILGDKK